MDFYAKTHEWKFFTKERIFSPRPVFEIDVTPPHTQQ